MDRSKNIKSKNTENKGMKTHPLDIPRIKKIQKTLKRMKERYYPLSFYISKGLIYCSWKSAKEKFFYPLIHKKILKAKKIGKAFYLSPKDVFEFHKNYYKIEEK